MVDDDYRLPDTPGSEKMERGPSGREKIAWEKAALNTNCPHKNCSHKNCSHKANSGRPSDPGMPVRLIYFFIIVAQRWKITTTRLRSRPAVSTK